MGWGVERGEGVGGWGAGGPTNSRMAGSEDAEMAGPPPLLTVLSIIQQEDVSYRLQIAREKLRNFRTFDTHIFGL